MNVKPQRIQRQRKRGWKMPPNTVYVGRPSKWGNQFKLTEDRNREDVWRAYVSVSETGIRSSG